MSATWGAAERVANALLYEGYLLYPYHRSALKNQFRWQFGVVGPCGGANQDFPSFVETQVLIEPRDSPVLDIKLRFLHVETRNVQRRDAHAGWRAVDSVTVGGVEHATWSEARPVELLLSDIVVGEPFALQRFARKVPGWRTEEIIPDERSDESARVIRERLPLTCEISVEVTRLGRFLRLSIRVENATPAPGVTERDALLRHSLVSLHTLLRVRGGEFISLLEPPADAREHVAECRNQHTWPVLAGSRDSRDSRAVMLSSPIVLYDYPAIAPESQGELCDGTEIDEILTLRVLTLTDAERRQASATDPLARAIVARGESASREMLAALHGAERRRGAQPASPLRDSERPDWERWFNPIEGAVSCIDVDGRPVAAGSRIRLRPKGRADAIDMFLAGEPATVAGVFQDVDGGTHIAVTLAADRAAELHDQIGRFLYFRPEEIELRDDEAGAVVEAPKAAVLVAGIGNMFLGDDGFGPAVVQRLASRALPAHVRVEDYGIRGLHLAYEILGGGYSLAILVDAMSRGDRPGTTYAIEPEADAIGPGTVDAHSVSVETVLGLMRTMAAGGTPPKVLIVGCEPESLEPSIGLSERVAASVDVAADRVMELIASRGS